MTKLTNFKKTSRSDHNEVCTAFDIIPMFSWEIVSVQFTSNFYHHLQKYLKFLWIQDLVGRCLCLLVHVQRKSKPAWISAMFKIFVRNLLFENNALSFVNGDIIVLIYLIILFDYMWKSRLMTSAQISTCCAHFKVYSSKPTVTQLFVNQNHSVCCCLFVLKCLL